LNQINSFAFTYKRKKYIIYNIK